MSCLLFQAAAAVFDRARRATSRLNNLEQHCATLRWPSSQATAQKGGECMNEKDPQGEVASSQRPRSPRVPVEFALDVEGTDASGNPFQAKAKATKISRGGATIAIDVDVSVGSVVKLIPPFGGTLDAQVNGSWTDDIDGNRRIGVKLLDENGWFGE